MLLEWQRDREYEKELEDYFKGLKEESHKGYWKENDK